MPRFPWSVRAENGCNRRVCLVREASYRPGIHNSKPRIYRGPRRQPAGRRMYTSTGNRGPGISGRIGEASGLGPTDPGWPLPWAAPGLGPAARRSNGPAVRRAAHAPPRSSPPMRRAAPTTNFPAAGGRRPAGETRCVAFDRFSLLSGTGPLFQFPNLAPLNKGGEAERYTIKSRHSQNKV
jgi:hypothetical protein